jgi:SAM-dependent methyltransferase
MLLVGTDTEQLAHAATAGQAPVRRISGGLPYTARADLPHEFHENTDLYFDQQRENALGSILPFVDDNAEVASGLRVLEIGCGAGGVLKAFAERGARVTGVDLHEPSIDYARRRFAADAGGSAWRFELRDIYDVAPADIDGPFDLIVMKDAIEHIHDQRRLFERLDGFLAPSGRLFFAFPPWRMPFGGHQQICRHKVLMRLPYFHLLPRSAYAGVLRRFGEAPETVDALLEVKQTGIGIDRFERIAAETGHRIAARKLYLVNPMYQYRYGLAPREQLDAVGGVPVLRDFVTTSAYYLLAPA